MIADKGCWVYSHSLLVVPFLFVSYSLMQIHKYAFTRSVSVKCVTPPLSLHCHYLITVASVFDRDHKTGLHAECTNCPTQLIVFYFFLLQEFTLILCQYEMTAMSKSLPCREITSPTFATHFSCIF